MSAVSAAVPARLALIAAAADRRAARRADLRAAEPWARALAALLRAPPHRAGPRSRGTARRAHDRDGLFAGLCLVCLAEPDTEPARGAYRTPEGGWICRWHWRRALEAVG